jgi:nicotinate-nucleotide adenylyltransferase
LYMRIGVFGGTFDPVHLGHLILAEQCREQARLEQVWFVPSARPPHKPDLAITSFDRRADMLQLALAGQPTFRVEPLERDRPGPSFTADTLDELHRRDPAAELFLLLGSDCLPDLPSWHEPQRIVERATLLMVARPGFPVWTSNQVAETIGLANVDRVRMLMITMPPIGISSRDLRQRAAEGRSLLYQVPRAVEVYIKEKGLYRQASAARAPGD